MDVLNFMSGAKTFLGGLVLVAGGIAGMVFGVVDPGTGAMLIGNGVGLWGIGGKMQKMVDAAKDKAIVFPDGPQKELVKALATAAASQVPSFIPQKELSPLEQAIVAHTVAKLTAKETPNVQA